jgi:CHAD domain-containing protein
MKINPESHSPILSPVQCRSADSIGGKAEISPHMRFSEIKVEISAASAFRRLALLWLGRVIGQQRKAAQGDPAALHRMRVSIVHLRTACSLFSPMVGGSEWRRLRREFKWLNHYLGAARDLDVVLIRLRAAEDRPLAPDVFNRGWSKRCFDSHRRLGRVLQSRRYRRLISDVSRLIDKGAWTRTHAKRLRKPARLLFADKLERWHEKLERKAAALGGIGAHERHHFRSRIKELRYAVEFFGDLFPHRHPSRRRAMSRCLITAQECLGDLNDGVKAKSLADFSKETDRNGGDSRTCISLSSKQEKRLKKQCAAAFREMAELKPFWS